MNRAELAQLLRRARSRMSPEDVGLPAGARRRVAGLRREEVAALAGVSVDYVVRLEQARGPHPSRSVLSALARALRLSDDERAELFLLADVAPRTAGEISLAVRPSIQRLMDRMTDLPTMLLSAKSDVLAWNGMAAALLGDWSALPLPERNIVWQRFLGVTGRVSMSPQERAETDAQAVANLRTTAARYPTDPGVRRLVGELRRRSPRFAQLWEEAASSQWRSHRKAVDHPEVGRVELDCDALHLPDTDQTLIVYSAEPASSDAAALALLRVIGTQHLGDPETATP